MNLVDIKSHIEKFVRYVFIQDSVINAVPPLMILLLEGTASFLLYVRNTKSECNSHVYHTNLTQSPFSLYSNERGHRFQLLQVASLSLPRLAFLSIAPQVIGTVDPHTMRMRKLWHL